MKRLEALTGCWLPEEYPALADQIRRWSQSRPLAGLRVLDGSPLFRNTVVKYRALLAAGADLSLFFGDAIPYDPGIASRLLAAGVRAAAPADLERGFDAVLDCAGRLAHVPSRLGYVELTRSGACRYAKSAKPVYLADAGRVKQIETALGTGDGFIRGMRHFGHHSFAGRRVLVFGCGKVGRGVICRLREEGARVTAVDSAGACVPSGVEWIDRFDTAAIHAALAAAWCAVSVTGIRHALAELFAAAALPPDLLLANMGVENEFGPAVPDDRVLNRNAPLNFALEEPTLLRYIDPALALHNAGLLALGQLPPGCSNPSREEEEIILNAVREKGCIGRELEQWERNCACDSL